MDSARVQNHSQAFTSPARVLPLLTQGLLNDTIISPNYVSGPDDVWNCTNMRASGSDVMAAQAAGLLPPILRPYTGIGPVTHLPGFVTSATLLTVFQVLVWMGEGGGHRKLM